MLKASKAISKHIHVEKSQHHLPDSTATKDAQQYLLAHDS